jgi:hypothetical protein
LLKETFYEDLDFDELPEARQSTAIKGGLVSLAPGASKK